MNSHVKSGIKNIANLVSFRRELEVILGYRRVRHSRH